MDHECIKQRRTPSFEKLWRLWEADMMLWEIMMQWSPTRFHSIVLIHGWWYFVTAKPLIQQAFSGLSGWESLHLMHGPLTVSWSWHGGQTRVNCSRPSCSSKPMISKFFSHWWTSTLSVSTVNNSESTPKMSLQHAVQMFFLFHLKISPCLRIETSSHAKWGERLNRGQDPYLFTTCMSHTKRQCFDSLDYCMDATASCNHEEPHADVSTV